MATALTTSEPPSSEGTRPPKEGESRTRHTDVAVAVLEAAQLGDARAVEEFVRHYQGPVFAFVSRSMGRGPHVEDLAQEVFLRVIRALPQFERRGARVSTWVFQIAVRLIQDHRKKPKRILVAMPDDLHDRRQSPEESCARRRVLNRVEVLVEELPREQRMALVLTEFHGLSHAEVAEILNCGVATVKTRLHRARSFLRDQLRGEQGELS